MSRFVLLGVPSCFPHAQRESPDTDKNKHTYQERKSNEKARERGDRKRAKEEKLETKERSVCANICVVISVDSYLSRS